VHICVPGDSEVLQIARSRAERKECASRTNPEFWWMNLTQDHPLVADPSFNLQNRLKPLYIILYIKPMPGSPWPGNSMMLRWFISQGHRMSQNKRLCGTSSTRGPAGSYASVTAFQTPGMALMKILPRGSCLVIHGSGWSTSRAKGWISPSNRRPDAPRDARCLDVLAV
jgi:hypothetical protein